ncbi:MAG: acyltransferase [Candidatus Eremiobacteraeota bacterium]|nr:acyltransferase [Candidatus Eremiobacteraeota bacterium]
MTAPSSPRSDARLDVLDGLRGIAILMVVWWHLWLFSWLTPYVTIKGTQYGFLLIIPGTGLMGVELFFFISGFVLFYPYARYLFEGRPLQTVKHFAERRFLKIVPSYAIALVAAAIMIGQFTSVRDVVWQIASHLLFIHTFWVNTWVGVNGVLWSLGVEIQFYLIFPALCWAFRRQPVLVYLGMVAIAVAYRIVASHIDVADYVLMGQLPAYLDLFGTGMLAAYAFVWLRNRSKAEQVPWLATIVAAGAAVGLYALLANMLTKIYVTNGYAAWQAVNRPYFALLVGVFTVAALFSYRFVHLAIANPLFRYLGIISYNLYLWHNVIMLYMLQRRIPAPSTADPHLDDHWKWIYTFWSLLISLAFSTLVTYAIELPILKKGWRAFGDLFQRRPQQNPGAPVATASDG